MGNITHGFSGRRRANIEYNDEAMATNRKCPECGAVINGRTDKKFCSDSCRSTHNNRENSDRFNLMRNVNHALRKNRRILEELNPKGKVTLPRQKLEERGFNFKYFTNMYRTRQGLVYLYCYEHGYLPLEKDYILLVRWRDWPHP